MKVCTKKKNRNPNKQPTKRLDVEPRMNNKPCEIKVNDPPGWIICL